MGLLVNEIKEFFGFELDPAKNKQEKSTESNSKKPFKGALINSQNARPFASSEIKVLEPHVYEDALNIASFLRENKPVIVNLKYLDKDSGKRLIDFICGTAYAINGHMMKIGENIFLFTPANVLIVNNEEKSVFEEGVQNTEKETFFTPAASM